MGPRCLCFRMLPQFVFQGNMAVSNVEDIDCKSSIEETTTKYEMVNHIPFQRLQPSITPCLGNGGVQAQHFYPLRQTQYDHHLANIFIFISLDEHVEFVLKFHWHLFLWYHLAKNPDLD